MPVCIQTASSDYPRSIQGAEGQISQKQGKKDVLFLVSPGICKHEIPRNFRNTCE